MVKQMTYKEMSNMSNQVFSELHRLRDDSEQFDLLCERWTTVECLITGNLLEEDLEDHQKHVWISSLTRNSIKLDLIKGIDEIVNFLVSIDSTHGLDIIDDIAERLPESAYGINYCSTLITNYFKGDYFND
ncbi:hypothetical protein EC55P2_00059 [Enterococcus phage EC55P2]|nr:hypothetical protein EC55P2_00059 [Enterococcus phage EC55P2]